MCYGDQNLTVIDICGFIIFCLLVSSFTIMVELSADLSSGEEVIYYLEHDVRMSPWVYEALH